MPKAKILEWLGISDYDYEDERIKTASSLYLANKRISTLEDKIERLEKLLKEAEIIDTRIRWPLIGNFEKKEVPYMNGVPSLASRLESIEKNIGLYWEGYHSVPARHVKVKKSK